MGSCPLGSGTSGIPGSLGEMSRHALAQECITGVAGEAWERGSGAGGILGGRIRYGLSLRESQSHRRYVYPGRPGEVSGTLRIT